MAVDVALSRQKAPSEVKKSQHMKFILMCFFLALDIGMSSTLDYDNYADDNSNLLAGLFGVQIIVQIAVFLILFLAAADTFLFQVGLLGILLREIALTLLLQVAYFALTIVVGAIRNSRYRGDDSHLDIIGYSPFFSLSVIQKVGKGPARLFS